MIQLEITPKPSRFFIGLSILSFVPLILIIVMNTQYIHLIIIFLLGILILICDYYYFYWRLFYSPRAIVSCRKISEEEQWLLYDRSGKEYIAQLLNDSLITSFIIILNFSLIESKNEYKTLILPRDSLPKDTFRQLKVLLYLK